METQQTYNDSQTSWSGQMSGLETGMPLFMNTSDSRDHFIIGPFRNRVAAARLNHLTDFFIDELEEQDIVTIMTNPPSENDQTFLSMVQSTDMSPQSLHDIGEFCRRLSQTMDFIIPYVERAHEGIPHGFQDPKRFADMLIFVRLATKRLLWLRNFFVDDNFASQAPEGFFAEPTLAVNSHVHDWLGGPSSAQLATQMVAEDVSFQRSSPFGRNLGADTAEHAAAHASMALHVNDQAGLLPSTHNLSPADFRVAARDDLGGS